MKVLIVDRTTTDIGGVKTYVNNLQMLLQQLGCEVGIYRTKSCDSFIDKFLIGGLRYIINKAYRPYGIAVDTMLFSYLECFILPKGYDFIIHQSLALQKNNERSVSIIHALWSDNCQGKELRASALKRLIQFEKRILESKHFSSFTVSHAYANHIANTHKTTNNIPVIENFLVEDFYSKPWKERANNILYTGQFNSRKNLPLLLGITRDLYLRNTVKNLSLVLIGSGPSVAEILELSSKMHLQDIVKIIRNPPRDVIKEYLSKSKIFMLPSTKESFSFSLLEAKLSGCITFALAKIEVPDGFIDFYVKPHLQNDTIEMMEYVLNSNTPPEHVQNKQFVDPSFLAKDKFFNLIFRA